MEEIGGLVPVDPHSTKVITQKIIKRISRKERQAVWDPVGLIRRIIEVGFGPPPKVANGLCTFLICPGPHPESNTVKSVGGILLQNERVMHTVRLIASRADLYIVGETSLIAQLESDCCVFCSLKPTLIAA